MSKIDDLNTQPKYDNALQVARTASIPSNEKYTAAEWNALISKTNEVVGRANLNTWDIVTNYSELPTDPVNGQKVYVIGAELPSHVGVQMMVNGNSSRGFYVYDAFSDLWVQKTSEGSGGELKKIGDGYGLQHQIDNPNNYGTLGTNAVNFTYSNEAGDFGATGDASHAEGSNTTAGSFAENARGVFNEIIPPISKTTFNANDVVESVGVGVNNAGRKNALTRWKNGAWKWLLQNLGDIKNAVLGFHAADEDGRLNYYDGTEWKKYLIEGEGGNGKLDTDMNNLDASISDPEREIIRDKLGAAWVGKYNQNTGNNSGSLAGFNNQNGGACSGSVGGDNNENTGDFTGSLSGVGLQNKTHCETSRGRFNLSESNHADSDTTWYDDDLIESVGAGTGFNNEDKLNLFARYKSGAFYWVKKTLSTITNAVKGFHAADEDGRLNYHNGTEWKKYLIEGEGGGSYIEILDQFNDVNGEIDLDLITEEGTYVLKDPRDEELNNLPYYGGDGPVNVQIDVFITDNYTMQRAIYFTQTDTKPILAYRVKHEGYSYSPWIHSYKEDYNGVSPTITANIDSSYNIYVKGKAQHYDLTLTDDTSIYFLEMIEANQTKVITITLRGDFSFDFPTWLKPLETNDDYDTIGGTLAAEIVINIKNGGATPSGYYSLQMIDYAL